MRFRNLVAASVFLLIPVLAHADSFTYNFNDLFAGFNVTGTVTTDTNSGVVAQSDLTGYNIFLNDGISTLNLTPGNSEFLLYGNSLTATPSGLFFNFDNATLDILVFQSPALHSDNNYLCYQGTNGGCDDFDNAHESVRIGDNEPVFQFRSGNLEIASMANTEVPEPQSLMLLGTGLVGLVCVVRRRLVG